MEIFDGPRAELGEAPFFHEPSNELWWVDLYRRRIHATSLVSGTSRSVDLQRRASFVFPGRDSSERLLGAPDGLVTLNGDHSSDTLISIDETDEDTCLNDGKADERGRLWVGTLSLSRATAKCALYRVDLDGSVDKVLTDVGLSNGLGWSPDGSVFYYIDSHTQTISAFDFDSAAGSISNRRFFAEIPGGQGMPDGLAVDQDGGVWVALYRGAAVHRYGLDGKLDQVVTLPATYPTSVAFGGATGRTLFVTTAMALLSEDERKAESAAGRLLALDVGVAGTAVHLPAIEALSTA